MDCRRKAVRIRGRRFAAVTHPRAIASPEFLRHEAPSHVRARARAERSGRPVIRLRSEMACLGSVPNTVRRSGCSSLRSDCTARIRSASLKSACSARSLKRRAVLIIVFSSIIVSFDQCRVRQRRHGRIAHAISTSSSSSSVPSSALTSSQLKSFEQSATKRSRVSPISISSPSERSLVLTTGLPFSRTRFDLPP